MALNTFDVEKFAADFAYTLDGGREGELEYENFNAARAQVTVHGKSVHPGSAKNIMVNAMLVFFEFNAMLPAVQRPEHTEGREGFYHLVKMGEAAWSKRRVFISARPRCGQIRAKDPTGRERG